MYDSIDNLWLSVRFNLRCTQLKAPIINSFTTMHEDCGIPK